MIARNHLGGEVRGDSLFREARGNRRSFPARTAPRAIVGCPPGRAADAGGRREHPGMQSISFSPLTRSVLARFHPHEISQEEIVLRIAFHLSLDYDSPPVRLLAAPAAGALAAARAFRRALAWSLAMRDCGSKGTAGAMGLDGGNEHCLGGGRPCPAGAPRAGDIRSGSPFAGLPAYCVCSRQFPRRLGGHLAGVVRTPPGRAAADRRSSPPAGSARPRGRPTPLRIDDRPRRRCPRTGAGAERRCRGF